MRPTPSNPGTRVVAVPELLAPAGDWECARAAVENGADAIYFGLERFNARMRAKNFTEADLPRLMEFLHVRGVKGFVTFNTLVFTDELGEAARYVRAIIAAGADAAIVQDVGIARLIRRISPDFPIHASTQMTITSAAGVEFARELGCNLVVLARECSIAEIDRIQPAIRRPQSAMLLEVFVHGALCVAYSGQCLTSESLGGRSANRGECAQACRLPYELVSDGREVPLGDRRYLLSPQDLAGLEVLPQLARAGVASLKIEGRLKSPEYVASITRVYREALENLRSRIAGCKPADSEPNRCVSPRSAIRDPHYEMEMTFSRGLFTGWLGGIDNQRLVHARFGKKRGVFLGQVSRVDGDRVLLRLENPLKAGDGVVFDAGRPDEPEQGGRVFEVHGSKFKAAASESALTFLHGAVDFSKIAPGDRVWKTGDPALERELRQTFEGDAPRFQRPIHMEVHGHAGSPLTLITRDESGHVAHLDSSKPLAPADRQPLTDERLRAQLGRLGGTPFHLGEFTSQIEGAVMLPVSELNRLRREAVAELQRQRAQPRRWTVNECGLRNVDCGIPVPAQPATPDPQPAIRSPQLIPLVRTMPQLDAALASGAATIYCELEDVKKYRDAVARVRIHAPVAASSQSSIFVAPPRITKPGEEWILNLVRSSGADGYLVRNYDHLNFFADCRRIGDFSLNVANPMTAEYFIQRFGLERLTAGYDLNIAQLEALLRAAPAGWFEVTIHQHMPMFHMEHCVFCAFLSKGKDFRDCGRPCDHHDVRLRDRVGMEHPLKADAGCRNTVFNARAQTGAEFAARLIELGVRQFRVEFVNESPAEVTRTLARYQSLLRGEITGTELWRELRLHNQLGVTRGQLEGARPESR